MDDLRGRQAGSREVLQVFSPRPSLGSNPAPGCQHWRGRREAAIEPRNLAAQVQVDGRLDEVRSPLIDGKNVVPKRLLGITTLRRKGGEEALDIPYFPLWGLHLPGPFLQ